MLAHLELAFELVNTNREANDRLEQALAQAGIELVELGVVARFVLLHQAGQQGQLGVDIVFDECGAAGMDRNVIPGRHAILADIPRR